MAASRHHGTTWVPMAANNLLRRNDALVQLSCLVPPIFRSFAIPDLPESCDEGRSISLRGLIARAWLSVPAFSCSRAALCRHLSLSQSQCMDFGADTKGYGALQGVRRSLVHFLFGRFDLAFQCCHGFTVGIVWFGFHASTTTMIYFVLEIPLRARARIKRRAGTASREESNLFFPRI
jgi:hypothetical protein